MSVFNLIDVLRTRGAGGLVGPLGRVTMAPGVLAILTPSQARTHVSDSDLGGASRPLWIATTAYDRQARAHPRLARSRFVKRAIDVRFSGKSVARLLVLFAACPLERSCSGVTRHARAFLDARKSPVSS